MQGLELLESIKGVSPNTQRILLTGYAGLESAVRAVNERLLDKYLSKPIDEPVDFVNMVRHLIQEYHLRFTASAQRLRLLAQFEFIRAVTAAVSLDSVLSTTAKFMMLQLRTPWAAIYLWDADRLILRESAGHLPDVALTQDKNFLSELGGHALHLRQAMQIHLQAGGGHASKSGSQASAIVVPLRTGQTPLGVILLGNDPPDRTFCRDERMLTSFVADVAAITVGRFNDREVLESYYVGTMASLQDAVEAKDHYTRGHTDRVMELAVALAMAVGIEGAELKTLQYAAALHDLGKLAVPEGILTKPDRLLPSEYAIMKEHPARADSILSHLRFLDSARLIIRSHHERYDGKGYPDGLSGEEIPLGGRILTIVDSYDAMTSTRPYRKAMSPSEAMAEIRAGAGTQFDPRLVVAFVRVMEHSWTVDDAPISEHPALVEAEHD